MGVCVCVSVCTILFRIAVQECLTFICISLFVHSSKLVFSHFYVGIFVAATVAVVVVFVVFFICLFALIENLNNLI